MQTKILTKQVFSCLLLFISYNLGCYQLVSESHKIDNLLTDPGLLRTFSALFLIIIAMLPWINKNYNIDKENRPVVIWMIILLFSYTLFFFYSIIELTIHDHEIRNPMRAMIIGDIIAVVVLLTKLIKEKIIDTFHNLLNP